MVAHVLICWLFPVSDVAVVIITITASAMSLCILAVGIVCIRYESCSTCFSSFQGPYFTLDNWA